MRDAECPAPCDPMPIFGAQVDDQGSRISCRAINAFNNAATAPTNGKPNIASARLKPTCSPITCIDGDNPNRSDGVGSKMITTRANSDPTPRKIMLPIGKRLACACAPRWARSHGNSTARSVTCFRVLNQTPYLCSIESERRYACRYAVISTAPVASPQCGSASVSSWHERVGLKTFSASVPARSTGEKTPSSHSISPGTFSGFICSTETVKDKESAYAHP